MSKSSASGGGILIPGLTILFVGLKLTGYVAWPWWVVLSPLWGSILLTFLIVAVVKVIQGMK